MQVITLGHRWIILCLLLITTRGAMGETNEIAIIGGRSETRGSSVMTGPSPGLVKTITVRSPSFQISYSRQLKEGSVDPYGHQTVALGAELPLLIAIRDSSSSVASATGTTQSGGSGRDWFFTPGVRLKFFQAALVSGSGFAGFGVASFAPYTTILSGTSLALGTGARQSTPAFSFGTAFDVRIMQPVSIRVDLRDFITRSGLGGAIGRNHSMLQAGVAFHF